MAFQLSDQHRAWLLLSMVPYLGPATLKRLYLHYGSAQKILASSLSSLAQFGLKKPSLKYLQAYQSQRQSDKFRQQLDLLESWLEHSGGSLLSFECSSYPVQLKQLHDPPVLLYILGDQEVLAQPQIAMVGCRNASVYGRETAYQFSKLLSNSGWIPTSGLARGIDGQAHAGAIDGVGITVAVVGTGLDKIYPRSHERLAQRILDNGGAIVSEYPLQTPPRAQNFPRRNRIISGLSMATLVVEA